jgi:hypothetical protein
MAKLAALSGKALSPWRGVLRATAAVAIAMLIPLMACAREDREDQRITALISSVESLEGASFIRNGVAHDAKAAADHLRLKLGKAGARVKTAEDFIEGCASKSSITGVRYRIRQADGKEMDAAEFLREALKKIDAPVPAPDGRATTPAPAR